MNIQQTKAFTLVELIIVITILAILATIGFISYQSYTLDARDGKRVTDLGQIRNGLEIYRTKNSVLPKSDGETADIKNGSLVLTYQGYAGKTVLDKIRMDNGIVDPTSKISYTYSTNGDYTKYQLLSLLEKGDLVKLSTNISEKAYASNDYIDKKPYVIGDKLGMFLDNVTNTPVQETVTGTVDLSSTGTTFKVVITNDTSNSGTIIGTGVNLYNNVLTIANTNPTTQVTPVSKLNVVDFFGDNSGKALYRFENNANDEGGNYNGTALNVIYGLGRFSQGVAFNGTTTSRIETSMTASSIVAVSLWVNVSQSGTSAYVIGSKTVDQSKMSVKAGADELCIWINNKSTTKRLALTTGRHHIVGSYNGVSTDLYVDGLILTGGTSATLSSIGESVALGVYKSGYASTSQSIDQVRMFNRALTQSEVTQLYNEQ